MVLGLTGKYCSGKNLVSKMFIKRGWDELDVDLFGHEALKIKSAEVIDAFGTGIISENTLIDRKLLGRIVFKSGEKLELLESIIHPEMVSMCIQRIEDSKGRHVVINAAILHRMGLNRLCDSVLWIESGLYSRLIRARIRDGFGYIQIMKRIFSQYKLDAKYWEEDVDIHIIRNGSTREQLEVEVSELIDEFEKRE